jgi:prepilin-type N-terminal cleavage/methylation domain-containing protein
MGFSLIEMLIVVMLTAILAAMAVPVSSYFITSAKADSSVEATVRAIKTARDRAIAERRNVQLTFVMPDRIRLERQDLGANGVVTGTTLLSEVALENGLRFLWFSATGAPPGPFPATGALNFGGTPPVMFTSDGTLVDSNGDVINGSVFTALPNQPDTARAVTIFGVSGLTRAWKWRGAQWFE